MPKRELTKTEKGVLGILGGAAAFFGIRQLLKAAPPTPPLEWCCPYCSLCFGSYEALVEHVKSQHPGERIPLPIEWD